MFNAKELMANPGAGEAMDLVRETLESNEETNALFKAAHSIEDVYELAKKFVVIEFEKFKEVCESMMDYFQEDKAVLNDEVLDNVAGGAWGLSKFWNNVVVGTILGVCAVAGAALGTVVTAPAGAGLAGFLAGGAMGFGVGVVICEKLGIDWE